MCQNTALMLPYSKYIIIRVQRLEIKSAFIVLMQTHFNQHINDGEKVHVNHFIVLTCADISIHLKFYIYVRVIRSVCSKPNW